MKKEKKLARKNNKLRRSRHSNLRKGKVKGIGLFEKIPLIIAGLKDGRRGLPRDNGNNQWVSPFIERELSAFAEYSDKIWGLLQLEEETDFAKLSELMDKSAQIKGKFDAATLKLEAARIYENSLTPARKHGEEALTETQVESRRAYESRQRLEPLKIALEVLSNELTENSKEVNNIYSKISEDINTTRMICHKVRDRTYQRISVYWNSALNKHPDSNAMPAVPKVNIDINAEDAYMTPHKELLSKAKDATEALSKEMKEAA